MRRWRQRSRYPVWQSTPLAFLSAGLHSQEFLSFSHLPLRHPALNEKFQLMCRKIMVSTYLNKKTTFLGVVGWVFFGNLNPLNPFYIGFYCLPWQKRCQQDGSFSSQPATHISNSHSSCQVYLYILLFESGCSFLFPQQLTLSVFCVSCCLCLHVMAVSVSFTISPFFLLCVLLSSCNFLH